MKHFQRRKNMPFVCHYFSSSWLLLVRGIQFSRRLIVLKGHNDITDQNYIGHYCGQGSSICCVPWQKLSMSCGRRGQIGRRIHTRKQEIDRRKV